MIILGVESSCDETGLALYDSERGLLGHVISSQTEIHDKYGGVVPELASRDHVRKLVPLFEKLLSNLAIKIQDINLISFTNGPGLLGPLLTGAAFAKSLAWINNIDAVEVDHLEAHIFSAMMSEKNLKPPFISLLVSGGHTLISNVDSQSRCTIVGKSLDDSAGEVFDKVARKMGLKYPGGPEISRMADKISKSTFKFTRPMINSNSFDMSFSGLKTNVIREINKLDLNEDIISDIAYDFQECVIDILIKKTIAAARFYTQDTIAISGGVSANKKLRDRFKKESGEIEVFFPSLEFSTDNGAMISYLGYLKSKNKKSADLRIKPSPTSSLF